MQLASLRIRHSSHVLENLLESLAPDSSKVDDAKSTFGWALLGTVILAGVVFAGACLDERCNHLCDSVSLCQTALKALESNAKRLGSHTACENGIFACPSLCPCVRNSVYSCSCQNLSVAHHLTACRQRVQHLVQTLHGMSPREICKWPTRLLQQQLLLLFLAVNLQVCHERCARVLHTGNTVVCGSDECSGSSCAHILAY